MQAVSEDKLFFSALKESREGYFVEYQPPVHGITFATLQLTFPERLSPALVAHAMENEALLWHERFPIPLMVSAFDEYGDLFQLENVRPANHFFILRRGTSPTVEQHWRLLRDDEIPTDALDRDLLLKVYAEVGRRTSSQVRAEVVAHGKKMRAAWYVVFAWIGLGPIALLVLEYFGPGWLAAALFVYGLSRALVAALKLLGKWKKSPTEIAKEAEERRMEHHHYHCEQNPEGFWRLKVENLRRQQREQIAREAESLKLKPPNG